MAVDINTLIDIAGYFRFRWDPVILMELHERPSRFRALASRLEIHVGEHVDDNALSRSLHRLARSGLITADCQQMGRRAIKVYRLTDKGREHVAIYSAFVAAFTHAREHRGHEDVDLREPACRTSMHRGTIDTVDRPSVYSPGGLRA